MAEEGFEGGCVCGAVRYASATAPLSTVHCHCTVCQRLSGAGHATHSVIRSDGFTVSGETANFVRTADSGRRVDHRFCPVCSGALFHTRDGLDGFTIVRTGSMDEPERARPERSIYADSAFSWDPVDPSLPSIPGMTPPKN